jgi:aminoglycoside phosphotransferase (APT) family kinase protein
MSPEWSAEQVVTEELARELIETQFPELRPVELSLLGEGWDNTAWQVNGTYVFRFPRRTFAVPLLETETALLPKIAPQLSLPIPVPIFVGRPVERFPWPFAGYRILPGRTADRAVLNDKQRRRAARPLARLLRTLHSIDPRPLGAPPDTLGRLDMAKRIPQMEERLAKSVELGLIEEPGPWLEVLRDTPVAYIPCSDTLVHGDLYSRHVLVDADGAICGVIDWGDVHRGDAAVDLSIAHSFLPHEARAEFCAEYGSIDEVVWRMARFRAMHHAAITLIYGHALQDEYLVRESRGALDRLIPE